MNWVNKRVSLKRFAKIPKIKLKKSWFYKRRKELAVTVLVFIALDWYRLRVDENSYPVWFGGVAIAWLLAAWALKK